MQLTTGANAPFDAQSITLSWAANPGKAELDISAFLLAGDRQVMGEDGMVFHGQPSVRGAVLRIDQSRQSAILAIDVAAISPDIQTIALCAALDTSHDPSRQMAEVGSICVTAGGVSFDVNLADMDEQALILVEIYRRNGAFKIKAVGQGYRGGLGRLATSFGVDISDDASPAASGPAHHAGTESGAGDRNILRPDFGAGRAAALGQAADAARENQSPSKAAQGKPMSLVTSRLTSMINYIIACETDKLKIVTDVNNYRVYKSYHDIVDLPGVHFNAAQGDTNIWLQVERLDKQLPPAPTYSLLTPWIILLDDVVQQPRLKTSLSVEECLKYGIPLEAGKNSLLLSAYDQKDELSCALHAYIDGPWTAWSMLERERRKSIALYSELFSLNELLSAPDGTPQEFVCGIGFATLERGGKRLRYPLITVPVEIDLNKHSHILSVIPREEVPPMVENGPLEHMGLWQVDEWASTAQKLLTDQAEAVLSPFSYESYGDILRRASGQLDPEAVYQDGEGSVHVPIPAITDQLVISNSFAFIQRERRATQLMADLTSYRSQLEANMDPDQIPGAIAAMFTEPSDEMVDENFPMFRGINSIPDVTSSNGSGQDLYFPKPFNGEQVQIAQRLAVRSGVVVQGPPGTGKTHTIANIISHYLATGKRVLVTAQKASALQVLSAQLPKAIRPLAVSLLDSDREGLRQFQGSVELIAQTLQSLRVGDIRTDIDGLERQIDGLHRKLARNDGEIDRLGRESLQSIKLDDVMIEPLAAAKEVLAAGEDAYWISDPITTLPDFAPQFDDDDIAALRSARRAVGAWISYLGKPLPDANILSDVDAIVAAHNDLSTASQLQRKIQNGEVWALNQSARPSATDLLELSERLQLWCRHRDALNASAPAWDAAAQAMLHDKSDPILKALRALGNEAQILADEQGWFLTRPIGMRASALDDPKFRSSLEDLRRGGNGLGAIAGLFAAKTKQNLAAVRIRGKAPATPADWDDVARYIEANDEAVSFVASWNHALSGSGLPRLVETGLAVGREALSLLTYFEKLADIQDEASRLTSKLHTLFVQWTGEIARHADVTAELTCLQLHVDHARLAEAEAMRRQLFAALGTEPSALHEDIRSLIEQMGDDQLSSVDFRRKIDAVQLQVNHLHSLEADLETIAGVVLKIRQSGAAHWADTLGDKPSLGEDDLCPADWAKRWRLRRLATWLDASPKHDLFRGLHEERQEAENDLARAYTDVIEKRTWLALKENASPAVMSSLQAYSVAVGKIGKGTGKGAARHRHTARQAANGVKGALPCWIMPHYRVSESLPSEFGIFDLVIVDEASQSDLSALPALFRARQILIVGDDKQVSPDKVGLDADKANARAARFLADQVPLYAATLREESSLYDVGSVIFGADNLMLREHFRSVAPIIEYSKRHFYRDELRPLRISKASERLDPVLIDVRVVDGFRSGKINRPEAEYIVSELGRMGNDPAYAGRTFGVTTLLGTEQAALIYQMISRDLGIPFIERHNVRVGDPATFQGDERDIMFLSLVVSQGLATALSGKNFDQRFNVAASRARERMVLVRSIDLEQLSPADSLRRTLIEHFHSPFPRDAVDLGNARDRCESDFEREMFDLLAERGYQVDTQIKVGAHRIDMVIEGDEDRRLAIECDGDRYHGPEKWPADMARQRTLERAGWRIWRCFASRFVRERDAVAEELVALLTQMGIQPRTASERSRQYTEYREWNSAEPQPLADDLRHEGVQDAEPLSDGPIALNDTTQDRPFLLI